MDEIRIYEQSDQVSVIAADMLKASVFDDIEYTQALPAFSSGWRGSQVALFIPEQ